MAYPCSQKVLAYAKEFLKESNLFSAESSLLYNKAESWKDEIRRLSLSEKNWDTLSGGQSHPVVQDGNLWSESSHVTICSVLFFHGAMPQGTKN